LFFLSVVILYYPTPVVKLAACDQVLSCAGEDFGLQPYHPILRESRPEL